MDLLIRYRELLRRIEDARQRNSRPGRWQRIICDGRALYRELDAEVERVRPGEPELALVYAEAADVLRQLVSSPEAA